MTVNNPPHILDYYMDGHIPVAYCKVCSVEGLGLHDPCQGSDSISTEQRKMARYLDLNPDTPETWPIDILDKLIWIKEHNGEKKLFEEIRKMHKYP